MEWRATVDGQQVSCDLPGNATLAEALRQGLDRTATKVACGEGVCGACSTLVDGFRVHACIFPAFRAAGTTIQTATSFADGPVTQELVRSGGIQCGFCTPGMVVTIHAAGPEVEVTAEGLRRALAGNLCRCTGYAQLVEGATAGLARLREGKS